MIYYGLVESVGGHAITRTFWRLENGLDADGHEAGWENKRCYLAVAANPCLSAESRKYGQAACALIAFTMNWVVADPQRRREFFRDFATFYHANSAAENRDYAAQLAKIFLDERAKVRAGYYSVPPPPRGR